MRNCCNILIYKQATKVLTLIFVLFFNKSWGQVNITTTSYTQNFGTANITSWTNNSTFPGWYIGGGSAAFQGFANFGSAVNGFNAGGFYSYNCGSGDFASIGGRGSGNACCGTLYYGVVLRNTTGLPIQSVRVSYRGYQMSLAQNGGNANIAAFQYSVSTAPPLIAGGGNNFAALNFIAPSSSATGGGNQINWFPCNNFIDISSCIPIVVPNNSYILFRWREVDDGSNDHHMAIDNVRFDFGITAADCSIILPIELIDFYATKKDNYNQVTWKVADEINIDSYLIEKSEDGINFSLLETSTLDKGEVYGQSIKSYSVVDENPFDEITYYRLATKTYKGNIDYHKIISVNDKLSDWKANHYQQNQDLIIEFKNTVPKNSTVALYDLSGKLLIEKNITNYKTIINTQIFAEGLYFIKIQSPYKTQNFKLIIQK